MKYFDGANYYKNCRYLGFRTKEDYLQEGFEEDLKLFDSNIDVINKYGDKLTSGDNNLEAIFIPIFSDTNKFMYTQCLIKRKETLEYLGNMELSDYLREGYTFYKYFPAPNGESDYASINDMCKGLREYRKFEDIVFIPHPENYSVMILVKRDIPQYQEEDNDGKLQVLKDISNSLRVISNSLREFTECYVEKNKVYKG